MDRALTERVLAKLGFTVAPEPTLTALAALYATWCRKVPFDNVRKLIHVRSDAPEPLPGDRAQDFFEAWLSHGSGGTCWAGNGALHDLLVALGWSAKRAVATMIAAPNLPPNHGSVVVTIDEAEYVVDASILHHEPLRIRRGTETEIDHPAWGVTGHWVDDHFSIRWRNFLTGGAAMECAFNSVGANQAEFSERHETTRGWSPFNFGLSLNLLRDDGRIGAAWGHVAEIDETGAVSNRQVDLDARRHFLIEKVGMSEELVSKLPDDIPMTGPPKEDGDSRP